MFGGDTTWYHMPFSARIAQDGSTVHLHFTDPLRLAAWFYPAAPSWSTRPAIVLFKSDWLSPLLNLIWLAIALLAAWCIGRPYKVGPATLVAAAIVLDAGVMIETQPGEGRNDIMGLAFLLAFAAFLINGHQRRAPAERRRSQDTPERDAPLLDKGPLVHGRDRRRPRGLGQATRSWSRSSRSASASSSSAAGDAGSRPPGCSGLSTFVIGGYWYVRAMVKTGGNPIPQLGLRAAQPAPARPDAARPAAALRRRRLPDRADDLPQVVLPGARQRASARSGR